MGTPTIATMGGLTFSSVSPTWKLIKMIGWHGGPSVRGEFIDRPTANGIFKPGKIYRTARVVTLQGFVISSDEMIASEDWDTFAALSPDGLPMTLSVSDAAGTRSLTEVTLMSAPEITPVRENLSSWMVQVIADDPVKYGDSIMSMTTLRSEGGGLEYNLFAPSELLSYGTVGDPGRDTLVNVGTADTFPEMSVSGGAFDLGFNIQVLETGEILTFSRAVLDTDTITISNRTGRARVNGQSDVTTSLTRADFFAVPGKGTRTIQFTPVGTSTGVPILTSTYAPGFW